MTLLCLAVYTAALVLAARGQSDDTFYFYYDEQQAVQDVVEGQEATLRCDVSNRRHLVFQWAVEEESDKAEKPLRPVTNTTRRFQEDTNLRVLRVLRELDKGPFRCVATNLTTGVSRISQNQRLNIQWIDEHAEVELKRPRHDELTAGVDVTLKCAIAGHPIPTILWYHNKFRLFNQEKVKIFDKNRIKLLNISAADNGVYSCRAENVAGAVDSATNFLLNVNGSGVARLVEEQYTPHVVAARGEAARLDCPFQGANTIDWYSNYEKLGNTTRHTVYGNGSLYFPKLRASDEGSYRCEGLVSRNSPSATFTADLFLAYLDDIHRDSFEPRLIINYPVVIPVQTRFEIKVFPPKGRPKPSFWWRGRSGAPVPASGPIHVSGHSLVFENPQEIDSGNYTLVVNNSAGLKERSVWVMVSVPPVISRDPQAVSVKEDDRVELMCQVQATQYPVTKITWAKNTQPLPVFSEHYEQDLQEGRLVIRGVQLSDMGNYSCVANTSGHPLIHSNPATLSVTKRLKFWPLPEDKHLEMGKVGVVDCRAEAQTAPKVTWVKDNGMALPDHLRQHGTSLVFSPAQREDSGNYTCRATDAKNDHIAATIHILIVETPSLTVRPSNVTVLEGQAVQLHCVARGFPPPHILWYRDSQLITPDSRRYVILQNGTLNIRQVFIEDNGMYSCVANNSAGLVRWQFYLRVTNQQVEEEEDFNMVKTIIIAVCSAGAYLALVIGLTAFCSYRLLTQCRSHKALPPLKTDNGDLHREQHELLMKERDSCTHFRSDSDNRSVLSSQPSHSSQSQQSRSRRPSLDRLAFPRHQLNTLGIMGKGSYGEVFLARARGVRGASSEQEVVVVVKALLVKGEREVRQWQGEMELFGRPEHVNVARLLGVCREVEPHFLITEYCDWGDLKQFLLATRSDNGRRGGRVPALTAGQKANMAQQVAGGMEALAAHGLVHGDLAARNVLLTSRLQLKVAKLALCGDVYASEYYPLHQRLMPLRWLAPEVLAEEEAASAASDVWAFGVFLWELCQLGDLPYRLLSDQEVLVSMQQGQAILDPPDLASPALHALIQRCTALSSAHRPTFPDVISMLALTGNDVV